MPVKRHRVAGLFLKLQLYTTYRKLTSVSKTHESSKWKDGKDIFQANGKQQKADVAILTSEKKDFKPQNVVNDKDIIIKGSVYQEDITIINTYDLNTWAPKCIKQIITDLIGEIDNTTVIIGTLILHCQQTIDHPDQKTKNQ